MTGRPSGECLQSHAGAASPPCNVELREEPVSDLREHASIPATFDSESIYDVRPISVRWQLVEHALDAPFRKDYDAFEDPLSWGHVLGKTRSVLISAFSGGQRAGGIIAALAVPDLVAWPAVTQAAILWDVRVDPGHRRRSIATSLLRAVEAWGRRHGCPELCVETQNTNVAACKFYMQNGFVLRDARRGAYPQLPEDVQLIWAKALDV